MRVLKQSTAYNAMVFMTGSADHVTGLAGLTLTITASKDGAAFAAITPTVTDLGSGWYNLALTTAHTNTVGDLVLHITGAAADPTDLVCQVFAKTFTDVMVAADVRSAVGLASANLDSQLSTIDDFLDTEVSAIKAKTDQLTFTAANKVDSTIQAAGDFAQAAADKVWSSATRTLTAFGFTVTVGTNNDKTGYSLSAAGIQAIWDALTSALTTVGSIGKLLVDNIDAAISSRLSTAGYTAPPSVGAIADQVWDEAIAGHLGAGSTGLALNSAGAAGDPWSTALPGAYGAGTAGKIIGDNINATISSRATQTSVDAVDDFLDTEIAAILADTNELQTDWANGGRLDNILDARASQTSVDDLPTNAELATALGTADDAVLAAIAALNNLSQANIRTAIGLASANLDTQLDALPTNAELATALGTADDAVLAAVAALNNLSSAQVQTAAAAALTAYDPPTHAELISEINSVQSDIAAIDVKIDAIDNFVDTEVAAIKAVTDKLDTAMEVDGPVYRFTANALEQAPSVAAGTIATAVWAAATRSLTDKADFTLSAADKAALVVLVEAALINEGDGQMLLDAIMTKINTSLDVPALEQAIIAAQVATAVRTELALELARIDVAISTRADAVDLATVETKIDTIDTIVDGIDTVVDGIDTDMLKLDELHQVHGLRLGFPVTTTPISRITGAIDQAISGDGINTSTIQRNP